MRECSTSDYVSSISSLCLSLSIQQNMEKKSDRILLIPSVRSPAPLLRLYRARRTCRIALAFLSSYWSFCVSFTRE